MRKSAEDRKAELIETLVRARQDLIARVSAVPVQAQDQPYIGIWSVKDLIAHLIGWDFTNRKAIQEILEGNRPTFLQYYDADWKTYNARLVAQHYRADMKELLDLAESSNCLLIEFLCSLTPSQILEGKSPPNQGRTVTIRNLLRSEAQDEHKHTEQVQGLLEQLSGITGV